MYCTELMVKNVFIEKTVFTIALQSIFSGEEGVGDHHRLFLTKG